MSNMGYLHCLHLSESTHLYSQMQWQLYFYIRWWNSGVYTHTLLQRYLWAWVSLSLSLSLSFWICVSFVFLLLSPSTLSSPMGFSWSLFVLLLFFILTRRHTHLKHDCCLNLFIASLYNRLLFLTSVTPIVSEVEELLFLARLQAMVHHNIL